MFFAIGGIITYEVVARYFFVAPTIWAEEVSEFFQIWATYLGAAYVLRHRQLIRIEFAIDRLGPLGRRWADGFSLVFIAVFCLVAVYYGMEILLDSIAIGRSTSTMLSVPKWMTESAVPLGFSVLFLQCVVELARLVHGRRGTGL